ncbi:MAG: hypothetical protein IJJ26_13195, partial [Victivallales bacterium]|nr:hypothetical protein [Victivallales bacterium]
EQWYLEWLQEQINNAPEAACKVAFKDHVTPRAPPFPSLPLARARFFTANDLQNYFAPLSYFFSVKNLTEVRFGIVANSPFFIVLPSSGI